MKPKIALFFLTVIFVALLTACGRQPTSSQQATMSPLVGIWQSEHTVLEFSSDGTGVETREGRLFEFSWIENDGILTFSFAHDAEGSAINALMQAVLHGEQVESFGFYFSDDGNELTITDDHGHGHFRLILTRTEYVGQPTSSIDSATNGTSEPYRRTVELPEGEDLEQTRHEELGLRLRSVRTIDYAPEFADEFEFLRFVVNVVSNSAGYFAGIRVGDLILTINGNPNQPPLPQHIDSFLTMESYINPIARDLVFRILRDGEEHELTALLY